MYEAGVGSIVWKYEKQFLHYGTPKSIIFMTFFYEILTMKNSARPEEESRFSPVNIRDMAVLEIIGPFQGLLVWHIHVFNTN